jgi:hypothetical protein
MTNGAPLTRTDYLRRVVLLCSHFMRNLAYYRTGQRFPDGWKAKPLVPTAPFWRTVNGNFIDVCVLEWCKLFGDKITTRADRQNNHYWGRQDRLRDRVVGASRQERSRV